MTKLTKKSGDNATDARHQRQREDLPADLVRRSAAQPAQVGRVVVQQRHRGRRHRGVRARQEEEDEEEVRRAGEA